MTSSNLKTPFPPLRPVDFHVLLAVAQRDRHGYGIVKEIEARTDGRLRLLPGNLYPVLRRLVARGFLKEGVDRPAEDLDRKQRRYYGITPFGKRTLLAEVVRMKALVEDVEIQEMVADWAKA